MTGYKPIVSNKIYMMSANMLKRMNICHSMRSSISIYIFRSCLPVLKEGWNITLELSMACEEISTRINCELTAG